MVFLRKNEENDFPPAWNLTQRAAEVFHGENRKKPLRCAVPSSVPSALKKTYICPNRKRRPAACPMKKTNQRLLYLLPLLLTVALIVFGEALGDLWKEDVKALFQQNKWLLLAFVLLLALVGFLWERRQRSEKAAPEAVDKDQYDEAFVQFRKNLLEQYQTRLNSKTGRRLPVNLTAKSTHFGTAPDRVQAYFKDKELTIESENIASEIDKILKTNERLLLVGDPGAGKTTILLYAAINILNASYSSDDFESSDEVRASRSDDSKSSDRSSPQPASRASGVAIQIAGH